MNNLESEIYRLSFELSQLLDDNNINKLLGVLASDGVYAMWVYAMDKIKKETEKKTVIELITKLNSFLEINSEKNNQIDNNYFQTLAQDLKKLLFMKELLEKVLTYAIYHARAKGED